MCELNLCICAYVYDCMNVYLGTCVLCVCVSMCLYVAYVCFCVHEHVFVCPVYMCALYIAFVRLCACAL